LTVAGDGMKYPDLENLIGAYLHQDYAYYADTIEGVIEAYKEDATAEQVQRVRVDIANFLQDHQGKLDQAFDAVLDVDFNPRLWDLTVETFLKNLDRQLQENGKP
jgi:hypothetical protein